MNEIINIINNRKSVRAYDDKLIDEDTKGLIIQAAMRAPTAGNMMLYSILEVEDQAVKEKLARSCDHQPFIAKAPLVLIFLADYQRWFDFFIDSDVLSYCVAGNKEFRYPGEGDLLLACCDALIAAQTAVIAAESMGLGSCYIGDILENYEYHRELLDLPQYVFPITLLCLGHPKRNISGKTLTTRFPQKYIHFKDTYQKLGKSELGEMFKTKEPPQYIGQTENTGQHYYSKKFSADFSVEMTRSVKQAIKTWTSPSPESLTKI